MLIISAGIILVIPKTAKSNLHFIAIISTYYINSELDKNSCTFFFVNIITFMCILRNKLHLILSYLILFKI